VSSVLFLSPHPDDLVYSAFCAITESAGVGRAVVFFNVSRFTKWGLLPKHIVTMMRSLEEKLILARLQIESSFLWMEDSSCRPDMINQGLVSSKLMDIRGAYQCIYCPLGISGHTDHLAVRSAGVDLWLRSGKRSRICFYEDLPYAARLRDVESEVETRVRELTHFCGQLSVRYHPMDRDRVKRKMFFSRLYITQNNHSRLLRMHAKELGKRCRGEYAEKYVSST
jgi:LmbE family N-acetylglucosaminyl deacetylase